MDCNTELKKLEYHYESNPTRSFQREYNDFVELQNIVYPEKPWKKLTVDGDCGEKTQAAIKFALKVQDAGEVIFDEDTFMGPQWRFITSRIQEELKKRIGRNVDCDNDPLMLRFIYRERRTGRLFYTKPKKDIPNFHGNPVPQKFIEKIYINQFLPLKTEKDSMGNSIKHFISVNYSRRPGGPFSYEDNKAYALNTIPQAKYVAMYDNNPSKTKEYDLEYIQCESVLGEKEIIK